MAKGVFVKIDLQATHLPQATIIPFATPNSDGSMSKEQAAKLASIPDPLPVAPLPYDEDPEPNGEVDPGGSPLYSRGDHVHPGPQVTPVIDDDYDADPYDVVQCDSSEGGFDVDFPPAAGNKDATITVWVIPGGNPVNAVPNGGDRINSVAAPFAIASGARTFISDGVDNWLLIATA